MFPVEFVACTEEILNEKLHFLRYGYTCSRDNKPCNFWCPQHCMISFQIRSFFWSVFSCIRTEYVDLNRKSPYSVRMRENTDQKKLHLWILLTQCKMIRHTLKILWTLAIKHSYENKLFYFNLQYLTKCYRDVLKKFDLNAFVMSRPLTE